MEQKSFMQSLPYFDRMDYVSAMSQEHTFTLAYEMFYNKHISTKSSYIRVMFLEITRILNHLMALTTHSMDIGAFHTFFVVF